jgi:adenine-specific DNA-methyltransferase
VLKVDSSNMKDVYYRPEQVGQAGLFDQVDVIKDDRTGEDLLFQVMLELGVELTLPIQAETLAGHTVYRVDDNAIVACFDDAIDENLVRAMADKQPLRAVFRDAGFADDSAKINATQIFKQFAPHSELKTL